MQSLHFTAGTSSNGVIERDFTVGEVTGNSLVGRIRRRWRAPGTDGPRRRPAQDSIGDAGRASRIVTSRRFTVAAIDARGHGGPPRTAHDEQEIAATQQARAAGEPVGPIVCPVQRLPGKARRPGMADDPGRLQELPEIGGDGPVGYYGLNMGAPIGVRLTAVEPRITAAVFGLFWPDLAEVVSQITIPIAFDSSGTTPHRSPIRSRCSTPSPRRKDAARQRGTSIRCCAGSRPTARSCSSPNTSAGTAHHRPDMTGYRRPVRPPGAEGARSTRSVRHGARPCRPWPG